LVLPTTLSPRFPSGLVFSLWLAFSFFLPNLRPLLDHVSSLWLESRRSPAPLFPLLPFTGCSLLSFFPRGFTRPGRVVLVRFNPKMWMVLPLPFGSQRHPFSPGPGFEGLTFFTSTLSRISRGVPFSEQFKCFFDACRYEI